MSRKLIIGVCCLNVLLGIGLLWLILTPRKPFFHNGLPDAEGRETKSFSADELLAMAEGAPTARAAHDYLRRLEANAANLERMHEAVGEMASAAAPVLGVRPYFEGLVAVYGSRAASAEELAPLARAAERAELPLTLREAAFRAYIQNVARFPEADPARPYALIDALSAEPDSLAGTALRAEAFLREQDLGRAGEQEGGGVLEERAKAMLLDDGALEGNRLAAAEVLSRIDAPVATAEVRQAFEGTRSERLRLRLLGMIAASDAAEEELAWLADYRPATPEEERRVEEILERAGDDKGGE